MQIFIKSSVLVFLLPLLFSCAPKKMITTTREPPKIKSMKAENCGEGKIYTMGHWTMKEGSFEWVDGKCKRKKDGQNFIPAHWEKNQDDVWVLKQGRWEEIIPSEEK